MIHVFKDKNNIPEILRSDRTKKAMEEIKANNITPRLASIYRHSEIKERLNEIYKGKCAYCEWKPQIVEIDQFVPKSVAPLLAFDWENLLLVCPVCNQNKRNHFPIAHNNEPLLLNPEKDQPEEHLSFFANGEMFGITEKGRVTIEILKLNRIPLVKERISIYNSLFDIFTNYLQTLQNVINESSINSDKSQKILNVAFDYFYKELTKRTNDVSEYALFGRYILKNFASLFIEKTNNDFYKIILTKAVDYFNSKKSIEENNEETIAFKQVSENLNESLFNTKNINTQYQQLIKELYQQRNPEEIFELKDLVKVSQKGRAIPSKLLIENIYNGSMPDNLVSYIRVSELASDSIDYKIDITKSEYCIEKNEKYKIIEKSSILVSLIGNRLKPTYFEYDRKPIVIGNEILALELIKDINIEYFVVQLNSKFVSNQVDTFLQGTTIKRIPQKDFQSISIPIPPIEVQLREILEIKSIVAEKFIAKLEIEKQISKTKEVEHNIIATLSHNFNQKLGSLSNDLDTLSSYLTEKNMNEERINFSEPIAPIFEGEDIRDVDTLSLVVDRLTNNLKDATQTIKAIERVYQKKITKKQTNIINFFEKEIVNSFKSDSFLIEVINSDNLKSLFVEIDKPAFKEAIQNFIKNAEKHGFVENKQYIIQFELSNPKTIDYISIIYRNNGISFPKGFTFEEFKKPIGRAGKNRGSGIGGAFINEVIQLHGGELKFIEIENEEHDDFNVQFEILLPKLNKK